MPFGSEAPTANERALANAYNEGANAGSEDTVKSYITTSSNGGIDQLHQYMRGSIENDNVNAVEIFVTLAKANEANEDSKILDALKACVRQSFENRNNELNQAYILEISKAELIKETLSEFILKAVENQDVEIVNALINNATKAEKRESFRVSDYPTRDLHNIKNLNYVLLKYWPVDKLREVQQENKNFFHDLMLQDLVSKVMNEAEYSNGADVIKSYLNLIKKLVDIGVIANEQTMKKAIRYLHTNKEVFKILLTHNLEGLLEGDISILFRERSCADSFVKAVYTKLNDHTQSTDPFKTRLITSGKFSVLRQIFPDLRKLSIDDLESKLQSPENASYLRSLEILYKENDIERLAVAIWNDSQEPEFLKKLEESKEIKIEGRDYLYRDLFFKMVATEYWGWKPQQFNTTVKDFHNKTASELLGFAIENKYGQNVLKPLLNEIAIDEPETLKEYFELATKLNLNSTEAKNVIGGLVTKGLDPNTKFSNGKSALETAVESNAINVVTALLANGANPNTKFSDGKCALQSAFLKGNTDVVTALLSNGVNIRIAWNRKSFLQHLLEDKKKDKNKVDNEEVDTNTVDNQEVDKNTVIDTLITNKYDLRVSWNGQSFLQRCENNKCPEIIEELEEHIQSANDNDSLIACALLAVASHLIAKRVFNFDTTTELLYFNARMFSDLSPVSFAILQCCTVLFVALSLICGAGVLYNSPPSIPGIEGAHEFAEQYMLTSCPDVQQKLEIK
jgi:hypothetical protein